MVDTVTCWSCGYGVKIMWHC